MKKLDEINSSISLGLIDSSCINQISFSDNLFQWQLENALNNSYYSSYYENSYPGCNLYNANTSFQRYAEGLGSVSSSERLLGAPNFGNSYEMVYSHKGTTEVVSDFNKLVQTKEIRKHNINIYPNPVNNALNIFSSEALIDKAYTVYNVSGIVVKSGKISAEYHTILLSDLFPVFIS